MKADHGRQEESNNSPNAGEVIGFVCDLLVTLQSSNRLCWQVEEAKTVLIALFSLDATMSQGKKERK